MCDILSLCLHRPTSSSSVTASNLGGSVSSGAPPTLCAVVCRHITRSSASRALRARQRRCREYKEALDFCHGPCETKTAARS